MQYDAASIAGLQGLGVAAGSAPEHSREIHERIAGSKLVMITDQRHFSNVEVPDQFNPPLRTFLDEVVVAD